MPKNCLKGTVRKKIGETKKKKLKEELIVDEAQTEIVNKIGTEINDLLDDQSEDGDSTNGVMTLFEETFQAILGKF